MTGSVLGEVRWKRAAGGMGESRTPVCRATLRTGIGCVFLQENPASHPEHHLHPMEDTPAQLQRVALDRSTNRLEDQVGELNQGSNRDSSNYCFKGVPSRATRDLFSSD